VVSRYLSATVGVNCKLVTDHAGAAPSGIYVSNSSYFIIDGITITSCGGVSFQITPQGAHLILGGVTINGLNDLNTPITAGKDGINASTELVLGCYCVSTVLVQYKYCISGGNPQSVARSTNSHSN